MHEIFTKFGLTFTRINESHLEIVRNWRNSDFVKSGMLFQDYITHEMHSNWFKSINNDHNYFYVVQSKSDYIAVADIKNIMNGEGELGFYLVEEKYARTAIGSFAYLALINFAFEDLHLFKLYSTTRRSDDILKFNQFFGLEIIEEKSGTDFYYLMVTEEKLLHNPKIKSLIESRKKK